MTGGRETILPGTLYAALARMVDERLVEESEPRHDDPSGGPPRRYYRRTSFGRAVARAESERLRALLDVARAQKILGDAQMIRRRPRVSTRSRCARFPQRHRALYAAEMIDAFERELAARGSADAMARSARSSLAACAQRVGAGIGERRRQRRVPLRPRRFSRSTSSWPGACCVRYPGLSIVGVFGMAVGIAIAAGAFTIVSTMTESDACRSTRAIASSR